MDTKALRRGFGFAAGRNAQLEAYFHACNRAADEIDSLRETLQTIRLATCDYTTGNRASLEAAHKLATAALKTPNAIVSGLPLKGETE